jgi:signal transduction histidine kinase
MDEARGSTQVDETRLLLELSRTLTSTLELPEVMNRSFAALRQLVDFDGGAIQLVRDGALSVIATDPPAPPEVMTLRIPIGKDAGVSGRIVATGEARYIPDITAESSGFKAVSGGVRSYFGWPLILHGEVEGVVQVDSPEVNAFTDDMQAILLRFAPSIAMAVQNALLFERQKESMIRLQEAQQMKKDFMSVISHELRTPLAAILGFAETLAGNVDDLDPSIVQASCDRILMAGKRLQSMIDDLLDLSEIERGLSKLEIAPLDVVHLIREVAFDPSSAIATEIEPDLPKVLGDDGRLLQVLKHLIDNARRFSPDEGTIAVKAVRDGKRVAISIIDQGRGIPAHLLPRVFEPFFQVEDTSTRTLGGLGVGLYLVKEICNAMDVDIDAWSEPDRGSRFTVRIPVAED